MSKIMNLFFTNLDRIYVVFILIIITIIIIVMIITIKIIMIMIIIIITTFFNSMVFSSNKIYNV